MVAKLDRLTPGGQIADNTGAATGWFSNLWQRTMTALEQRLTDLQDLISGSTEFSALNLNGTTVTTLGNAASRNVGTTSGTVAAGNDSRITGAAQKSANLTDLASASAARTALGLGGASVLNVGTAAATVAAGDDSRFTNAKPTYAAVATDADFTVTRTSSFTNVLHSGALTADRTATLSTTGAVAGDQVRLTRTSTGAVYLVFAGKLLGPSTWAMAVFDGSAWFLASYGTL